MGLFSTGLGFNNGLQSQRQFVAVASAGTNEDVTNVIMTSLDGVAWTTRNIDYGNYLGTQLTSVAWSPTLKLWAVGQSVRLPQSGRDKIWTSPDGIDWTPRDLPAPSGSFELSVNAIIWAPGINKFIVTGGQVQDAGFAFASSSDGITWVSNGGDTSNNYSYECIAYSPSLGRTVALRTSAQDGQYSDDLVTWNNVNIPGVSNCAWQAIVWAPEISKFIAVSSAAQGTRSAYSSDGATWTLSTPAALVDWNGLAWSPKLGLAVAVASSGTNRVMYTSDGINWSDSGVSGASSYAWRGVTWSEDLELFVAVGDNDTTMSSRDGLTWVYADGSLNPIPPNQTRNVQAVAWGGINNG